MSLILKYINLSSQFFKLVIRVATLRLLAIVLMQLGLALVLPHSTLFILEGLIASCILLTLCLLALFNRELHSIWLRHRGSLVRERSVHVYGIRDFDWRSLFSNIHRYLLHCAFFKT